MKKIPTSNYLNHLDLDKAHHRAFVQALLDRVQDLDPEALQDGGDLRDIWKAAVATKAAPRSSAPSQAPSAPQAAPQAPVTWDQMVALATKAGAKFPELVAAQGALESGWYKTVSGKNNYFGLKGNGTKAKTSEFVDKKWIEIEDSFIDFSSVEECVKYLVEKWYKDFPPFKGVNRANSAEEAAKLLVSEGYATDPKYAEKLIKIMKEVQGKSSAAQQNPQKPAQAPKAERSGPGRVRPSDPFSTHISASFTLGEFALGQEARRFTEQYQVDTAAEICAFLERVRVYFKQKPVIITSGYRPPAINAAVGGASNSEHLFSEPNVGAVDFYIDGVPIKEVQDWCDKNWPYSIGYGAPRGFVHLGIRAGRPKVRWNY